MENDGTLVLAGYNGTNAVYYVYAPGSSTPSNTITESIVPQGQQDEFLSNDMTVGPDGTLYASEFTYGAFGSRIR